MTDTNKASERFASVRSMGVRRSARVEDTILFENEHFVVIPSLGSLVAGWLLIVAKRSVLSCSRLDREELFSLRSIIFHVVESLKGLPGKVYAFEHGARMIRSASGCGVDQAHLHLVPLKFDLVDVARKDTSIDWRVHKNLIKSYPMLDSKEYITVFDPLKQHGIVGFPQVSTSQWARKLIAKNIGLEDEWDYRNAPRYEEISRTITMLSQQK